MNEFEQPLEQQPTQTEPLGEPAPGQEKKRTPIEIFYDYLETFCYALAIMMFLLLFVFRMVSVSGGSMRTTLESNDKLIISNLFYTPKTGDIVVISPQDEDHVPIIKRVIATGGQTVYIDYDKWEVYVDGVKLDEPYIEGMRPKTVDAQGNVIIDESVPMENFDLDKNGGEFVVAEGHLFVMGDNRNGSSDSRRNVYGQIDCHRVLGRVIIRLAPNFGFVD